MTVRIIPYPPKPYHHYRQRVAPDGTEWDLEFHFNTIDGYWYLDIYANNGTPILVGHRLLEGHPVLSHVTTQPRPRGELFPMQETTPEARWILAYVEQP